MHFQARQIVKNFIFRWRWDERVAFLVSEHETRSRSMERYMLRGECADLTAIAETDALSNEWATASIDRTEIAISKVLR